MTSEKLTPIWDTIWDAKYRFKKQDGTIIDKTTDDTDIRVAKALSKTAGVPIDYFYNAIKSRNFLPGGRIIAGAGTGRDVTLFNCYVMPQVEDSMEGIMDTLKTSALTQKQGGGIGVDFSAIRPKGADVKGVGSDASGPISFMHMWDTMCRTILSAGSRRGAMMGTLHVSHPDIFDFIDVKQDQTKLRMFNLSVLVSDRFMTAVENDYDWDLVFNGEVYKTVKARYLWNYIMDATYNYAEPGVIFIDRINKLNNLHKQEKIIATNPCGEVPLPPYGACLLGSVNLANMIEHPFKRESVINIKKLEETVEIGVRLLDAVIDNSKYPLVEQEKEAKNKRRLGLGITGLGDMFAMLNIKYGSKESINLTRTIMRVIMNKAYQTSAKLAAAYGPYPLYDEEEIKSSAVWKKLNAISKKLILKHGLRNSHLTSIAPTGTISLYAQNISSGLEPIFSLEYNRKILQKDGSTKTDSVQDYAYRIFKETYPDSELPESLKVNAMSLSPMDHLKIQAACQEFVDQSISKTINCDADISNEDFADIYLEAYKLGCKGCTTYRPNNVTGSILSVEDEDENSDKEETISSREESDLIQRYPVLKGETYKIKWPNLPHSSYVTINDQRINGVDRPFEMFINSKNLKNTAWSSALTRMISAVMRRSSDVSFIVEELKAVNDPAGGFWHNGKYVSSELHLIGEVLEHHIDSLNRDVNNDIVTSDENSEDQVIINDPCPECGGSLVFESGCNSCKDCGYSKCG